MQTIIGARSASALAVAWLVDATLACSLSAATPTIPAVNLTATRSGNDLVLSFPTTNPGLYTLQTSADLAQPWTSVQVGLKGDGTVKSITVPNALAADQGFYRLWIQTPAGLTMSQSAAFAILGHWCGGIVEHVYVTGFDPINGYPMGDVHLSTSCSTGHASPPAVYTAWAAVTWDFAGNLLSATAVSNAPPVDPTFLATDEFGDTIYNGSGAAYLAVPVPAAPTNVSAEQSGDQFQVSWMLNRVNPLAVTSSTLTATPVNSTAPVLTTTVSGPATSGSILSLQPQTTYLLTIVNTTVAGSSPASAPLSVTTEPASIPPSAPAGVTASWANLDPTGTNDTLVASWQAAVPGDSPIDQYQITITGSDGGGTFTQTVSGPTLTASFTIDFIPNWSVTVQAHNAVGWGPWSNPVTLGGL